MVPTTHPVPRREVAWNPSSRSVLWGAVGGFVASFLVGFPFQSMLGGLTLIASAVARSDSLFLGWLVHLSAGVLLGALFGMLVRTTRYGRGLGYGLAYGAVVGMMLVWLGASLLTARMPALDAQAVGLVTLHAMWGGLVGMLTTWGLRETAGPEATRRDSRRAIE